jgi:methylated-DNA-protein-cysteine methyltransferase-like protein
VDPPPAARTLAPVPRAAGPADPATAPRPPGAGPPPEGELTPFQARVAAVVAATAPGDVLTYAEVATEAGHPGAGQAVANVLRRVPGLAWWRVVPTGGRLYRSHAPVQAPLLRRDGVPVGADRVVGRP